MLLKRTIAFTFIWLAFVVISTVLYASFIHDVMAAYWSAGYKALPLFVLAFGAADKKLMGTSFGRQHPWLTFAGLCLVGLVLYYPATLGVMWSYWWLSYLREGA